MNIELQREKRMLSFAILIFIGLYLLTNTNNNPNAIIQRIFRPIHIGTGTVYYAGLFPILLIYYSLKEIFKISDYRFLNTTFRRIIILILLLSILPSFSQSGLKFYKSFYNDLNSIYCYRNSMNLSVKTIENRQQVVCKLELENCSSKSEEFYVKVNLPSYLKEVKESTLINKDTLFVLNANERRQFEIIFIESSVNNGSFNFSGISSFEFSLYNDLHEVKFTQGD